MTTTEQPVAALVGAAPQLEHPTSRPVRAERRPGVRVVSLDGLRGIAALVVLFHHALLTVPALALPYASPSPQRWGTRSWLLTYTPLHLVWDGTEAVYVFFVLSGFVLSIPFSTGRGMNLLAYYPRRLLRLYVPVWAAVWVALGWMAFVPRRPQTAASWWTNMHPGQVSKHDVLHDALLVYHAGATDMVLWSLTWEVIFSLLLPVVLLLVLLIRRPVQPIAVLGLLAAVAVGTYRGWSALALMPMFVLGSIMAFRAAARSAPAGAGEATRARSAGQAVLAVAALLLLNSYWYVWLLPNTVPRDAAVAVSRALEVAGACLLVHLAMRWAPLRRLLARRPCRWLGSRSFSLYLVHEPIVVSVAMALHSGSRIVPLVLIALPLALCATEVFYRCVERPSISLARNAGVLVAARLRRRRTAHSAA